MNRAQRASQIWAVLSWAARSRQTITYGQLAKLLGVPTAALGQLLEPIQSYCKLNALPPLTVLVVQQESGLPGSGFTGAVDGEIGKAQAAVYDRDWLVIGNPGEELFEEAVGRLPSNGI